MFTHAQFKYCERKRPHNLTTPPWLALASSYADKRSVLHNIKLRVFLLRFVAVLENMP